MRTDNTELVLLLVLSVVWAILGYRLSERDRRTLGRTPWGLPSLLWAFFWFLSLILGFVLYLIAHTGGVRRAQRSGVMGVPGAIPPFADRGAAQFPTYPRPAHGRADPASIDQPARTAAPAEGDDEDVRGLEGEGQTADSGTGWTKSPPAWHPDPGGRFEFRWWDGYQWTTYVSKDGQPFVDTSPDQRIGPY